MFHKKPKFCSAKLIDPGVGDILYSWFNIQAWSWDYKDFFTMRKQVSQLSRYA